MSTGRLTGCRPRLTLELKCSGLDAEAMARRAVEPSTMSLPGLVRHLAETERATFRVLMAGHDAPRLFCSATDRDGDFDGALPDPAVAPRAVATTRGSPGSSRVTLLACVTWGEMPEWPGPVTS